jgi:hypothetical protein
MSKKRGRKPLPETPEEEFTAHILERIHLKEHHVNETHINIIIEQIKYIFNVKGYKVEYINTGCSSITINLTYIPTGTNVAVIELCVASTNASYILPGRIEKFINDHDINIPTIHVKWINVYPNFLGQKIGILLLGFGILNLYITYKLFFITLDDDSDQSGQLKRNIYVNLNFIPINSPGLKYKNEISTEGFKETKRARPSARETTIDNLNDEDDSEYEDIDDDEDDDISVCTECSLEGFELNGPEMFNDINSLIIQLNHYITLILQQTVELNTELDALIPAKTKKPKKARGTIKKGKYRTKRRVKSFKRKVKSKLKRENPINLTRSKSSAYSYK